MNRLLALTFMDKVLQVLSYPTEPERLSVPVPQEYRYEDEIPMVHLRTALFKRTDKYLPVTEKSPGRHPRFARVYELTQL